MNRGVVHSSPVQKMMAAKNPNWWAHNNNNNNNLNNFVPPHSSSPFLFASVITPESSWSHLSGLVGEEERSTALMNTHQPAMDQFVKQEINNYNNPSSPSHHGFVSHLNNEDFSKSNHNNNNNSFWSPPPPHNNNNSKFIAASNSATSATAAAASSPQSCLSNNLFEFSSTTTAKSDHLTKPDQSNSSAVKKAKAQTSAAQSTFKVRKFGDRITTLHQLVSPFGKTDTASVLLEAIGYVRFLQSQIEALSLPYLSSGPGNNKKQQPHSVQGERKCIFPEDPGQLLNDKCLKRKGGPDPEEPMDLRSRGLCLVPVSSTLNMGKDIGADYWAPTLGDFQ